MVANSIIAIVEGGTDQDIAEALNASKGVGPAYNGAVNVIVTDPASGQDNSILFDRFTPIVIFVEVTIDPTSNLTDPVTLTEEAVIAYATGQIEGFVGFVGGADVNPFDMNDGINAFNSSINATRVEVGLTAPSVAPDNIPITLLEIATVIVANIVVIQL